MLEKWREQIFKNQSLVAENSGAKLVAIVSGNPKDGQFWNDHFNEIHHSVFNNSGNTEHLIVTEKVKKGNFLGILNAWMQIKQGYKLNQLPNVILMSMVFGRGKRLSPFTQALGNRKSAFPTPLKTKTDVYLTLADATNLYSNNIVEYLTRRGFRGVVVKWGDEIIVPDRNWSNNLDYQDVDVVRFYGVTEIDPNISKEKEWYAINRETGFLDYHYPRQSVDLITSRFSSLGNTHELGLNIGSVALSYKFLDAATRIFSREILDDDIWLDSDPYVWIALLCKNPDEWSQQKEYENRTGLNGIGELEARYPDFFSKVTEIRSELESQNKIPFKIGALDFGAPLWIDWGLHVSLRKSLESLITQTDVGRATRLLLGITDNFDKNGNLIINSHLSSKASISNSIIIDSTILSSETVIRNSVVLGSKLGKVIMPHGGCSLLCAVNDLEFAGPNNIAFRSLGEHISLGSSKRHTSICLRSGVEDFMAEENSDFTRDGYEFPILTNRLSFQELDTEVSGIEYKKMIEKWGQLWSGWIL